MINLERSLLYKLFASPEKKYRAIISSLSASIASNIHDVVDNKTKKEIPLVKKEDARKMKKNGINEIIFVNNKKLSVAHGFIKSIDAFVSPKAAERQIIRLQKLFEISDFTDEEQHELLSQALQKIISKYEQCFNNLGNNVIKQQKEVLIENWKDEFPNIENINPNNVV